MRYALRHRLRNCMYIELEALCGENERGEKERSEKRSGLRWLRFSTIGRLDQIRRRRRTRISLTPTTRFTNDSYTSS